MKPWSLLLLAACAFPALAAPLSVADTEARLAQMTPGSKISCHSDNYGNALCTADDFKIELSDCDEGALFGSIASEGGLDLQRSLHADGQPTARLQDHQFVCVAATARKPGNDTPWHYVIAVPTSSVPECKGKDLCNNADLPITWKKPKTGQACERGPGGVYRGDCAAGWVESGKLDQYGNGI